MTHEILERRELMTANPTPVVMLELDVDHPAVYECQLATSDSGDIVEQTSVTETLRHNQVKPEIVDELFDDFGAQDGERAGDEIDLTEVENGGNQSRSLETLEANVTDQVDRVVANAVANVGDGDVNVSNLSVGVPNTLSLTVSQQEEVQEEIGDLLSQLRRLQDLQVTIEVRFVALNDNFFEQIGVDFDFDSTTTLW